jgi:hypothetical protein
MPTDPKSKTGHGGKMIWRARKKHISLLDTLSTLITEYPMDYQPLIDLIEDINTPDCYSCYFHVKAPMVGTFCTNKKVVNKYSDHRFQLGENTYSLLPRVVEECELFAPRYCRKAYPLVALEILDEIRSGNQDIGGIAMAMIETANYKELDFAHEIQQLLNNIKKEMWDFFSHRKEMIAEAKTLGIHEKIAKLSYEKDRLPLYKSKLKRRYKSGEIKQKEYQNKNAILYKEIKQIKDDIDKNLLAIIEEIAKPETARQYLACLADYLMRDMNKSAYFNYYLTI